MDNTNEKDLTFWNKIAAGWNKLTLSIRTSILTLFTTLMIIIGVIIISIHFYLSSKLLLEASEYLLQVISMNIEKEVSNFLKPAEQNINIAKNLIENDIILPSPSTKFISFLLANIIDFNTYSAAFWGDVHGRFYIVERYKKHNFVNEIISNKNNIIRASTKLIDENNKIIDESVTGLVNYDPRTRPWYVKAIREKKMIISDVYLFAPWGENLPTLGITIAEPVYFGNSKKLRGIFGIDVRLQSLSDFITSLRVTDSADIFILDSKTNILLAAKNLQSFSVKQLPRAIDTLPAWAFASIEKYQKDKTKLFYYKYGGKTYLAFYDVLAPFKNSSILLGIALPISEITAPLEKRLLFSIALTIMVLLAGMSLVGLASNSISSPIIKLANETQFIRRLDLSFVSKVKSRIKEIIYMQQAFAVMVQSLKSFASYVPLGIVKKLVETGELAHVGGENKEVTILFTDITGFTTITQKLKPTELMTYLSEYLEIMTDAIQEMNGTVDKYIGDSIMAFWGAPQDDHDQAYNACACALSMLKHLDSFNLRLLKEKRPQIKMRIGINTGDAIIGNVGSNDRLNYTAIGDSVNITSRLETLNKTYHTGIIVSESTYKKVHDKFAFRLLDFTNVRGREEGLYIYELLTESNQFGDKLDEYNNTFKIAFDFYMQGDFVKAEGLFEILAKLFPQDNLIHEYIKRCRELKVYPRENWTGIF